VNSLRVPIWPGVRLSIGGSPKPEAVRVVLGGPRPPAEQRTVRLISKRGWMLLLVSYDWRSSAAAPAKVSSPKEEQR
jgi:hypothetical protein